MVALDNGNGTNLVDRPDLELGGVNAADNRLTGASFQAAEDREAREITTDVLDKVEASMVEFNAGRLAEMEAGLVDGSGAIEQINSVATSAVLSDDATRNLGGAETNKIIADVTQRAKHQFASKLASKQAETQAELDAQPDLPEEMLAVDEEQSSAHDAIQEELEARERQDQEQAEAQDDGLANQAELDPDAQQEADMSASEQAEMEDRAREPQENAEKEKRPRRYQQEEEEREFDARAAEQEALERVAQATEREQAENGLEQARWEEALIRRELEQTRAELMELHTSGDYDLEDDLDDAVAVTATLESYRDELSARYLGVPEASLKNF